jgi:two-component system, sensor histidine kinase and response regulator
MNTRATAFFILFSLSCIRIHAQSIATTRMLEAELQNCKDTARMTEILTTLVQKFNVFDAEKCHKYGQILWEVGTRSSNQKAQADAAFYLSGYYHFDFNDSGEALTWALKALDLYTVLQDSNGIMQTNYRLGHLNFENRDPQIAISCFNESIKWAVALNNYSMIIMAYVGIGDASQDPNDRLKHYENALKTLKNVPNDTIRISQVYITLAEYYWEQNNKKKAAEYYELFYDLVNPQVGKTRDVEMLEMLARVCLQTNRYDECVQVANIMCSIGLSSGQSSWILEKGYRYLAEAYHRNGNDSLAFQVMQTYISLNDSLNQLKFSDRVLNKLSSVQSEYELKRKKQELELLQTKNKYENTIAYVLLTMILLLCGVIYYLFRMRKRENLQNQKLEQLNQTKDKLLSIISHDVRSPIQALQNIIRLFEQHIATKEDVLTVTQQVNASVQSMAQGLDNLFYWAQNQQQELKAYPELFNLSELVQAQLGQYMPTWDKKGITVDNQMPAHQFIYADLLHIRLIFNNLLGNAIKFTPKNGSITIHFEKISDKYGVLQIENTGEPIREEDIHMIFDPAIRYSRPGTNGEPGSGLGLSLTRDLVLLNSGNLYIQKNPGKGTIVSVQVRLIKQ